MTDDAQRDLEQKALRNVRSLVDKIETEDQKGNQKQLVAVIAVVAVVAALAAVVMMSRSKSSDANKGPALEIPPPKPPAKS
ncbi:hypothetical protein DSM104443_02921 [Usitatibacter rugosus]|uniref:Uncharacterized protein n=1 Tax=Usitatibacter rugosus TaxID=2732067 RepID=A0A6M4GY56_9PROT|nr:hypothetical protein [Usitatibacter rugosus]QJR11838.1 hypothetical protein DSM104443_02921 [Usitatibacter rugosus]